MRRFLISLIPLLIALSPLVFAGLITIENDVIIAGRLGINTYYPQHSLEVHGDAHITGYLNAQELRENGVPLSQIYAKISWIKENFYNKSKVDQLILGNRSEIEDWVQTNYYAKSEIDSWNLIKNYVLQQDLNANGHNVFNGLWFQAVNVSADYFTITENKEATGWFLDYFPDNGRIALVKSGYGEVINVNPNRWVNVSGWLKVEPMLGTLTSYPPGWTMGLWTFDVYAEGTIAAGKNGEVRAKMDSEGNAYFLGKVAIGTTSLDAQLTVANDLKIYNPADARYIRFFFGALNDMEFNGAALVIHPTWSAYDPNAVLYLSGDANNFRVGIGTDAPAYKLDVNGDARVRGHLYAEYIHIAEAGSDTGWYWDYFPDNGRIALVRSGYGEVVNFNPNGWINVSGKLRVEPVAGALTSYPSGWTMGLWTFDIYAEGTIATGRNGEIKAYMNAVGDIRGSYVYADYFRLTEGGCWGSVTGSCSGWEIDYYPEGSMVFRYTNDSGQTFTDMMKIYPFGVAMPFIFDKTMISRLEKIETFGATVNGWTTVLDTDYHGVVAIIFHNPWGAIDYVRVTIDGVTSTIPVDGHTTAEVPLPLVFVVNQHIKVELYSITSINVYYTVMWIRG